MAGIIAYTLIVAIPAFLLSFITPVMSYVWIGVLLIASTGRYLNNREDESERRGFWFVSMPAYVVSTLMIILWR